MHTIWSLQALWHTSDSHQSVLEVVFDNENYLLRYSPTSWDIDSSLESSLVGV